MFDQTSCKRTFDTVREIGREKTRFGWTGIRVALAALVLGSATLISGTPAAEASNNPPGNGGQQPPQTPCLNVCFTSFGVYKEAYPNGHTGLTFIYETNVKALAFIEVSASADEDGNGHFKKTVGTFKGPYPHTYEDDYITVQNGYTYYYIVRATDEKGHVAVKKGSVNVPVLVPSANAPQAKP
jgi:hypothetical protein